MKSITSTLFLAFLLFVQCGIAQKKIKGSGNVKTETREISDFDELRVGGAFSVVLKKSSSNSVILEMDDNILQYVETKVSGGTLKIKTQSDINIQNSTKLKVTVNYTSLNHIDISGACNLSSEDVLVSDDIICELSGAGKLEIEIKSKKFSADVSGAGSMVVSGESSFQRLDLSGAASYKAYDLITAESVVHASGASSARVNVTKKLDAHASGASSIRYKGSPGEKDIHKSGAASIDGID